MDKAFREIKELIRRQFSEFKIKDYTTEWYNGKLNNVVTIKNRLREVELSSGYMEIYFKECGITWMNGKLEKATIASVEKSIKGWLLYSQNSESFSDFNWLVVSEGRYLIEKDIHAYTKHLWKKYLDRSYLMIEMVLKSFHPVIRLIYEEDNITKLVPHHTMDRILFFPYIGDAYNFWKQQNKQCSFFSERNKFGYSIYIEYSTSEQFDFTLEYNGSIYKNVTHEKLGSVLENIESIEDSESIKYYVNRGLYLLKDVDDTTIAKGEADEIVKTINEKYGNEIEEAFYPL